MGSDAGKDKASREEPPSLDEFSDRLDRMRGAPEDPEGPHKGPSAMGRAMRLSTELLAGLFVGCLIGLGLDKWLNTSPLFLLLGIGVGFAAGVLNVARVMKE